MRFNSGFKGLTEPHLSSFFSAMNGPKNSSGIFVER